MKIKNTKETMQSLAKTGKKWSLYSFLILAVLGLATIVLSYILEPDESGNRIIDYYVKFLDSIYIYWIVIAGGVSVSGTITKTIEAIRNKNPEEKM